MIASRRRGQGMLPGLQEPDLSGGGAVAPGPGEESFWSSFSVVESLFSDDGSPYRGGDQGGSRLPFMRQLKSQEAFPPLPPSSSPYDDHGGSHSQQHHHHGSSHRRGGHSQRRGGGGSGEWITPHTNNHNGSAAPNPVGHHLFPPMQGSNGQNYYNAFNGYNQHFVGSPTSMNDGYGDGRFSNGSPTFSIFSDFHSRQQQQQQQQLNVALGGLSLGQNAFTAVPDIGVSVERHQQGYAPRGSGGVDLSSSPSAGYLSPSLARKRPTALSTTATTIIAPPAGASGVNGGYIATNNNKICCDEKALLEEDLPVKGLPFSLLLALPNEHLLKILSYLSGRDLANLQMVGKKRLAVLSTDNGLWKDLYMRRWTPSPDGHSAPQQSGGKKGSSSPAAGGGNEDSGDEWAWIQSLLQQNERWKDIFQSRHSAERWRIGTLKMFNGCWGFISQHAPDSGAPLPNGETLDIFFHRKDIAPEGDWYEDWWLKDTPGVSRSQKCGYWDTFLCGRVVRYKQRAAYAQGRRPQACNISFVGDERRTDRMPTTLAYGVGGTLVTPEGMVLPPSMRFASIPTTGNANAN